MHDESAHEDCRILVVDDNIDAADSLVSLLDVFGFKAYAVYGGAEAVMAAETMHPTLVFLDIDMPGVDGYQAATSIRQQPSGSSMELVALTARDTVADRAVAASVGFDRHVTKPIGSALLHELAERACPH